MRHDGPGLAAQVAVGVRVTLDQLAARIDRAREVFHLVQVVSCGTQHDRSLFVRRERVGEAQRTLDRCFLHLALARAGRDAERLAVGIDGGVTGRSRLFVRVIVVGRALILVRCVGEVLVLEEQVGELVVDARGVGIVRERAEQLAVPAIGLDEVRGTIVSQQLFLVERVVMAS